MADRKGTNIWVLLAIKELINYSFQIHYLCLSHKEMINRRNECEPPWQLGNDVRREGMREGYAKPWLAVIRGELFGSVQI